MPPRAATAPAASAAADSSVRPTDRSARAAGRDPSSASSGSTTSSLPCSPCFSVSRWKAGQPSCTMYALQLSLDF